jgi:hypothetical protein
VPDITRQKAEPVTAPVLTGRATERIAERLAELDELGQLARQPPRPSEREDSDSDERNGEHA